MAEETPSFEFIREESNQEVINNKEWIVRDYYQKIPTQPISCWTCSMSETQVNIIIACGFIILFIILFGIYYLKYHFKKSEHKIRKAIIDSIITIVVMVIAYIWYIILTFH